MGATCSHNQAFPAFFNLSFFSLVYSVFFFRGVVQSVFLLPALVSISSSLAYSAFFSMIYSVFFQPGAVRRGQKQEKFEQGGQNRAPPAKRTSLSSARTISLLASSEGAVARSILSPGARGFVHPIRSSPVVLSITGIYVHHML